MTLRHNGLRVFIVAVVMAWGALATAQQVTNEKQSVTVEKQEQPAPERETVVVQPVPAAPAPAPVQAAPVTKEKTVVHESNDRSFMGTIAGSTVAGVVTGALVGGA